MDVKQGNLVTLPGFPAFYDYEWYPQSDEVREMPRYNKHCIHRNGLFSATRRSEWAFMISLRWEQSKFTLLSPEFLVEFDDEFK